MSKTPADILRRISVHVEELEHGAFEWVLSEADAAEPDVWEPIKRSRKASRTYHAAMAEGLRALESLVDNLDIGPRVSAGFEAEADDEGETVDQRTARPAKSRQRETKPAKGSAFGFGLPQ